MSAVAHPLRTAPVPDEIWDVAAVVLGESSKPLTGWQLREACCAMSALGDSVGHISKWLGVHPRSVDKWVRAAGGKPSARDRRLDRIGILIALFGGRIALKGRDRDEAARLLALRGLTYSQIAHRLMVDNPHSLAQALRRIGVEVLPDDAWASEVMDFHRRHHEALKNEELIAA